MAISSQAIEHTPSSPMQYYGTNYMSMRLYVQCPCIIARSWALGVESLPVFFPAPSLPHMSWELVHPVQSSKHYADVLAIIDPIEVNAEAIIEAQDVAAAGGGVLTDDDEMNMLDPWQMFTGLATNQLQALTGVSAPSASHDDACSPSGNGMIAVLPPTAIYVPHMLDGF